MGESELREIDFSRLEAGIYAPYKPESEIMALHMLERGQQVDAILAEVAARIQDQEPERVTPMSPTKIRPVTRRKGKVQ